jgi:hypothetical protein
MPNGILYVQTFPRWTVTVLYTGKATPIGGPPPVYNCLAWSLGYPYSWIWPWSPDKQVTLDDFYALYAQWGATQRGGPIGLWGKADNDMKHGSIWFQFSPPGVNPPWGFWTSKMGSNILIIHRLSDISNGLYGMPRASVGPARPEAIQEQEEAPGALLQRGNIPQFGSPTEKPMSIIYGLSEEETDTLRQQVKKVKQEVKDLFEQAYAAWTQTWTQPAIQISSNPNDYARSQEFNDLVAMGPDILPLLVEKMGNGREFLVLKAIEQLLPSNLIFRPAIDDPNIFGGEQLRAHMTAKRWLASI